MKKILISPAHYILDEKSVSEFYYAATLIHRLALIDANKEYYVLCGYFRNKEALPDNIKIFELYNDPNIELNLYQRVKFYSWVFIKSIQLSFYNKFDIVWHMLPNGMYSYNLFVLFNIHKLFGIKRSVIGRLAHSYGEEEANVLVYEKSNVTMKKQKAKRTYLAIYKLLAVFSKAYFKKYDVFIFYNKFSQINFEQKLKMYFKRAAVIIPVGFHQKLFPFKKKAVVNKFNFLYLGNLIPRKNVESLITLCHELAHRGIDFELNIVGDGYQRCHLETLVNKFKLQKRVFFHGFIAKADVHKCYNEAHFVFLPSHQEAFGHIVLEAWSSGTVFVGSNIKVFTDIIKHEKTGYILDYKKSSDIDKFKLFLEDLNQDKYASIVREGHIEARQYTWDKVSLAYYEAIFK